MLWYSCTTSIHHTESRSVQIEFDPGLHLPHRIPGSEGELKRHKFVSIIRVTIRYVHYRIRPPFSQTFFFSSPKTRPYRIREGRTQATTSCTVRVRHLISFYFPLQFILQPSFSAFLLFHHFFIIFSLCVASSPRHKETTIFITFPMVLPMHCGASWER